MCIVSLSLSESEVAFLDSLTVLQLYIIHLRAINYFSPCTCADIGSFGPEVDGSSGSPFLPSDHTYTCVYVIAS